MRKGENKMGLESKEKIRPVVGVPLALMTFDVAPLIGGFLQELEVDVILSTPTNKDIVGKSLRYAYSESCLPMKLLHGHVADLLGRGADYVLIPNAIRMAEKQGDEDQRYSCPLVQSAPYIIRSVFDLGGRVLDPIIDLSRGEQVLTNSLVDMAGRLGADERTGLRAARVGLETQRKFEKDLQIEGKRTLAALEADPEAIGVVFLSRAYNAQDAGANLGMAQEMAKLGVVPIPMDFLPLEQVDVKKITSSPYWNYERKILAASKLIVDNPQLFGLFLSNFGCGPNSFIQNIVEDMMGGKPLGQIEIDEHAAEAGYITRLEALVDTIRGYRKAGLVPDTDPSKYSRIFIQKDLGAELLLPPMTSGGHARVVTAGMRFFHVKARALPDPDETSSALSRALTSGKECLPFRDTLGVILRATKDDEIPPGAKVLMPGAFGPCRLGKYAQEQQKILEENGKSLRIITTVSDKSYNDLGLGQQFERLAWRGIVAVDLLEQMLWHTRPYETFPGHADQVYEAFLGRIEAATENNQDLRTIMREARGEFAGLRDRTLPDRPLVGINGEIYLRSNSFCNNNLVRTCEASGLEVVVSSMGEWFHYITLRRREDAGMDLGAAISDFQIRGAVGAMSRLVNAELRKFVLGRIEHGVASCVDGFVRPELSPEELIESSSGCLPSRNGSEAVLSLGSGIRQMEDPKYAGVISVMPHGCMPGGIVAALSEQIARRYGNKPWIALAYDGFSDQVNPERIADLAEQVKRRNR